MDFEHTEDPEVLDQSNKAETGMSWYSGGINGLTSCVSGILSSVITLVGGKTAVYISHRLSSCKFCDHIAVFSGKTVAEYGTHDELVNKKDGIYAEMFQAQAQYYQKPVTE